MTTLGARTSRGAGHRVLVGLLSLLILLNLCACRGGAAPRGAAAQTAPTLSVPPTVRARAPEVLVIRAGHLVNPETGSALAGQTLVIRAGRIDAIGADLPVPAGATVVDMSRSWVLPGLFDAHTHLCSEMSARWHVEEFLVYSLAEPTAFRAIRGVTNARQMLDAGFTTVRDLGNAGEYADLALVRAIETGLVLGPTVIAAGRIIAPFGGQFRWKTRRDVLDDPEYYFADSRDEMRRAIRENVYYGAKVIKVVSDAQPYAYSVEDLRFIVEEAKNAGRRVAAHCQTQEGARRAALAGVASIEHGWTLDDSDFQVMKKNGVVLVSTDFPVAVLEQSLLDKQRATRFHEKLVDRLRRAHAAGVEIAFGTDVMTAIPNHTRGTASLSYLVSFLEAGIPAPQILRSMTTIPARLLGVEQERGKLEPGKIADLIAVPADPLRDIQTLAHVELVIKDGQIVKQIDGSSAPSLAH
jgi:imidazolonepropionase-like amidohydrolase